MELMQVEPPLAGEITQVRDAIPWVRCAPGNVYLGHIQFVSILSVISVSSTKGLSDAAERKLKEV